jgi:hypothetical protein
MNIFSFKESIRNNEIQNVLFRILKIKQILNV